MTYHQLQFTLHSDHALVQREAVTLASFLNIPWRALRNQLGEWGNPRRMRHTSTAASRVKLPTPYISHQAGVYVLNGDTFSPDSLKRPLETCPRAKFLHDRLAPPAGFAPMRYHLDAITQQAVEGVHEMVHAATQALIQRGYTPRFQSLYMQFLPELSFVVYSVDAVEPHVHRGFGRHDRYPGILLPTAHVVTTLPSRRRVIPTANSSPLHVL